MGTLNNTNPPTTDAGAEMPDYLSSLNPQQRDAVAYNDGPTLVIAGAGSGKTRVLTHKIVHLLNNGYEPYRIMALTFTNKAAREMKERIGKMVAPGIAQRLWMGTFHSIFLRILRKHSELLGFKPGFTIYDTNDSRSLIKYIIRELALDEKIYKPSSVAATISNAKNAMMTPLQYQREYFDLDRKARRPMVGKIFELYVERCKIANAMDFDDILFYTNLLLRDNPDILHHYQEFFRYVLVDEYQDTNFAQHLIVSQLVRPDNRFCVVGDDAQSIYSFRGANISNIINLKKHYPDLRTFRLERNYRSTQNIVNAAGSLIQKNTQQLKKDVYSENEKGAPVDVLQTYSDIEEAYVVSTHISASKLTEHDTYDDYAVLYRTNAQSRVLEEALRKRNIPYRLVGGTAFYQRKEVKDAIAYFRMAVNPDDDEALRRIINYPARGIGETTVKKLQAAATQAKVSIWTILSDPEQYQTGLNSGTKKKLAAFHDMISEFIEDNRESDAFELGQLIFNRTGMLTMLAHDSAPESIARKENLDELLVGLKDFVDSRLETGENDVRMQHFLSEVMLATDQDEKEDNNEPKVTLMTVHAAKGLEFRHVYIVGAEEELFPSAMAMNTLSEVEEERRLLYVAITRAEKTCVITYAKTRFRNGQTKLTSPSRFLSEIDPKYLRLSSSGKTGGDDAPFFTNPLANYKDNNSRGEFSHSPDSHQNEGSYSGTYKKYSGPEFSRTSRSAGYCRPGNLRPASAPSSAKAQFSQEELPVNTRIRHDKFGEGVIIGHGAIAGDPSITVDFGVLGIKKLMLKFARFAKL